MIRTGRSVPCAGAMVSSVALHHPGPQGFIEISWEE